jgi:hypothetical protein
MLLRSIKPYVAGVWDEFLAVPARAPAADSVLLLVEPDACTTLVAQAGVPRSISSLPWGGDAALLALEMRRVLPQTGAGAALFVLAAPPAAAGLRADGATRLVNAACPGAYCADYRDLVLGAPGASAP